MKDLIFVIVCVAILAVVVGYGYSLTKKNSKKDGKEAPKPSTTNVFDYNSRVAHKKEKYSYLVDDKKEETKND